MPHNIIVKVYNTQWGYQQHQEPRKSQIGKDNKWMLTDIGIISQRF